MSKGLFPSVRERGAVPDGRRVRPLGGATARLSTYRLPCRRVGLRVGVGLRVDVSAYLRMLTARATTRATVTRETEDWSIISILDHLDRGITSVGLKAVALVNERYR